jgi:hypothetical protein
MSQYSTPESSGARITTKTLPSMRFEILTNVLLQPVAISMLEGQPIFRFGQPAGSASDIKDDDYACLNMDAYDVRELFLSVSSPLEALDFFNKTGAFEVTVPQQEEQNWQHHLSWNGFLDIQRLVKFVMVNGFFLANTDDGIHLRKTVPEEFEIARLLQPPEIQKLLDGLPSLHLYPYVDPKTNRRKLSLYLATGTALEMIFASIYMDNLADARYELCGLEGCGKVFELKDNREKQYCCQQHAHHAHMKRKRKELAKQKAFAKAGTSKKSPKKAGTKSNG